ncbi:ATP synthase F1 subunit gamma [Candidatus Saccharibacteria bacterium]|nr:ATP synthase F1 subunit gamma [Candidatus Saccharibacteria bacterium]MBJ58839.1 ATP synthase F1 subunit gamma [Candidatus Saccharibacteria bacterium]|tara:strand:- start:809 stop:1678 length:870 start_codon:yes stop_codon:yes gene_type:complete
MPSTQALKSRIRSVKNTKQITKAMELVAASKMRRAQEATKASAPYTLAARQMLTTLSRRLSVQEHPLFVKRPVKTRLMIVVASDKGLAGAYNHNIIKLYTKQLQDDDKAGIKNTTITIGRRASQFVARLKDTEVLGAYEDLPDRPGGRELHAILDSAKSLFEDGAVDAVDVLYTDFISSINQEAKMIRVLPAGFEPAVEPGGPRDVVYEPSVHRVLDGIAYRLVGAQIFQALLDSRASEHSMRMMAMKNATDNASDLIEDLTLAMNKARQAAITQELAEISGGVEAISE